MRRNLFLTILMAIVISISLCACSSDQGTNQSSDSSSDAQAEQGEDNTFVVGMEAGYPPFNWTQLDDSNGAVPIAGTNEFAGGYDVQIAKKVAKHLGKELVIQKTEWSGLVPAVQSGVIDGIMAGMSPTKERKESIDFSDNYYKSSYVLVVRNDGDFAAASSLNDFEGAKITAQQGTTHYGVIDQISGADKQPAAVDFPAMRVALDSGAIDAYVTEMPEAVSSCFANENFVIINPEPAFDVDEELVAIAVGLIKNSEYTDKINEALSGITEEERKEIMEEAIQNQPVME